MHIDFFPISDLPTFFSIFFLLQLTQLLHQVQWG